MGRIRRPAVAGTFYPGTAGDLEAAVRGYLRDVDPAPSENPPKAMIAPHAGYVYSGPIAASAYAHIAGAADSIERVVLLGPAHRSATALPGPDSTRWL